MLMYFCSTLNNRDLIAPHLHIDSYLHTMYMFINCVMNFVLHVITV